MLTTAACKVLGVSLDTKAKVDYYAALWQYNFMSKFGGLLVHAISLKILLTFYASRNGDSVE